jgi:hypothetical protein
VYSKLHGFIHFLLALAIGFAGLAAVQAETPAPVPTTGSATVRGHITDPTGALIPGAKVTVTNALGVTVATTTADATGGYQVTGLAPGSYIVQAAVAGFAPFSSPTIQLASGQAKRIEIAMAMVVEQQSVTVTDEEETSGVSVEAGSNASAVVLKGKDLDALSDDPDELSNELSALAGPSAGPNGGQIYIDGFTGGQLPPKSAIREIRINQNPFSAEFDRLGYGRIEILTKPGTDVLHGRFFGQGNDDAFNTGNPITRTIPAYHSIQYNGTVSGALSKKASFFFSVEGRNNQNASIYTADTGVLDPATGIDAPGILTGGLFSPSTHFEVSPRIDLQLGQKNTLTMRYQYERGSSSGNIGSTSLPTQSSSSVSSEHAFQLSDSQIVNDHIVNETRLQYRRGLSSTTPVSTAPTVSVAGYFTGGGSGGQNSTDHTDHMELQNVTTMSVGAQAIKFGVWARDNRDANASDANFNGNFVFKDLPDYLGAVNLLNKKTACPTGLPSTTTVCGATNAPSKLTYTTGQEAFTANVFDAAIFFQDDWKVNRNLTLSGGLRWETQNHIADHSDWGPRVAFAYALDGHKNAKQAKTVLRGGYGFFYDRFGVGNEMSLERFNGGANSQTQTVITNPTCYYTTSLSGIQNISTSCGAGNTVTSQIDRIKPDYHSPYTEQFGTSLERQLTRTTTFTATYLHSFGVHQTATINANAYKPGTFTYGSPAPARPNPSLGIVDEFYPEAVFKQNQLIMNVNARFTPNFNVMGFYNLTSANSDTGTASNSYNLSQNYGRASFAARQMLFLMSNYTGPWGINFSPFLIAQAGRPYNITTNNDLTGDNFFNDRPSYASASSIASNVVQTQFGALDTVPEAGETLIPMNMATGPAAVAVNLRISRSIGIGPKTAPANGGNAGGPPQGGGGHGGRGGGFGGFGGPFGGPGGGGRGGMSNTGHKYSLNFSAQALNLFNDIDYGTPSGSLVPTLNPNTGLYGPGSRFGKSTSLAGGIFSSGSAARRIFFQAAFSF